MYNPLAAVMATGANAIRHHLVDSALVLSRQGNSFPVGRKRRSSSRRSHEAPRGVDAREHNARRLSRGCPAKGGGAYGRLSLLRVKGLSLQTGGLRKTPS